eukprot:CAMPEP_0174316316 /NCGR_PEP_ID=MMETSP0810-20121108/6847_1 /TAXON_ID=73025 ORGANISM="Eutreptiella gymnastica-like, Strain CCMP1594" /NCGR_SAMPLE_ID=MMETSP0810 /ASSEMBLY_ACC=CAM_ASM_000659 /LENGTH=30 /DNA_ID= /DNA_START= /DNA_END= /DNA_ORIENTATION=
MPSHSNSSKAQLHGLHSAFKNTETDESELW